MGWLKALNLALFVVIIAIAGWFLLSLAPPASKHFPEFGMEGLAASDFKGDVFAVHIFASHCENCRKERATIAALSEHIPVYGIAHQDTPQNTASFLGAFDKSYTKIGQDYGGLIAHAMTGGALPATFIVHQDLDILWRVDGPMDKAALEREVLPLIHDL